MNNRLIFFLLAFVMLSVLASWGEGGGGIQVTHLTSAIGTGDTTLNVQSTQGHLKSDYVIIGTEKIKYTSLTSSTFEGCTRGYSGTDAATHSINSKVMSSDADVISQALGFNIASTGSTAGEISLPSFTTAFFTITIPRLVTWDFAILKGNPVLDWVRIILTIFSIAFIFGIVIVVIQALGNILSGIFKL